jgi:hypothetical protein
MVRELNTRGFAHFSRPIELLGRTLPNTCLDARRFIDCDDYQVLKSDCPCGLDDTWPLIAKSSIGDVGRDAIQPMSLENGADVSR